MFEYELEKEFNMFRDLMEVIKLQRPDNELSSDVEIDTDDDDDHVGLFKVSVYLKNLFRKIVYFRALQDNRHRR